MTEELNMEKLMKILGSPEEQIERLQRWIDKAFAYADKLEAEVKEWKIKYNKDMHMAYMYTSLHDDKINSFDDFMFEVRDLDLQTTYAQCPHVEPEDTTCHDCLDNQTCEWAFDPYNTDGDCLAVK